MERESVLTWEKEIKGKCLREKNIFERKRALESYSETRTVKRQKVLLKVLEIEKDKAGQRNRLIERKRGWGKRALKIDWCESQTTSQKGTLYEMKRRKLGWSRDKDRPSRKVGRRAAPWWHEKEGLDWSSRAGPARHRTRQAAVVDLGICLVYGWIGQETNEWIKWMNSWHLATEMKDQANISLHRFAQCSHTNFQDKKGILYFSFPMVFKISVVPHLLKST